MGAINPITNLISFFQSIFTIVLALALGESFKQFVAEKPDLDPQDRYIHWNRFPALVSFLLLIFPFFHGMSRHFFVTYGDLTKLPQPYSGYLMFDGVAFTIESALFFIMSRALSLAQWRRFYGSVLCLLAVDSFWGLTRTGFLAGSIWALPTGPIESWIILNIIFAIVIFGILFIFRGGKRPYVASGVGLIAVFIRTFLDYYWNWNFYFPAHA